MEITKARRNRELTLKKRRFELGYYLIVTDTEATESNYMHGLKESLPKEYQDRIQIEVIKTSTNNLVKKAQEFNSQKPNISETWIILDKDKVEGFDKLILSAKSLGFYVGWSNPCIEIWFLSYFEKTLNTNNSVSCNKELKHVFINKTRREYKKNNLNIYLDLNKFGNEEKAIGIMKKKHLENESNQIFPSEQFGCSVMYKLVEKIKQSI